MKLFLKLAILFNVAIAQLAFGQDPEPSPLYIPSLQITPVWEYLISDENNHPLPILKGGDVADGTLDTFDGTSVVDTYGGFRIYDQTKALLGIRENGINETVEGHDADLAAMYPDRSLIWIDLATGEPLGIALNVGFAPVPLDLKQANFN